MSLGGDPDVVGLDGLALLVEGYLHGFLSEEMEEEIGGEGDEENSFRVHPNDLFVELHDLSHSSQWECRAENRFFLFSFLHCCRKRESARKDFFFGGDELNFLVCSLLLSL